MFRCCLLSLCIFFTAWANAEQSTCYGITANGLLKGGQRLPLSGNNFVSYSYLASAAGRTYVHSEVKVILLAAYESLHEQAPDKVFKYAESGFYEGGRFKPHKTHQNGLSVDFMVPVVNASGESVHLPTNPLNRLGYDIEFDGKGRYGDYRIDYEALAAHLVELDKAAKARGHGLWRVIFDPKLQPYLLKTRHGDYIQKNIQLSKKRSWVRHDEHYHVDFEIPCQSMESR